MQLEVRQRAAGGAGRRIGRISTRSVSSVRAALVDEEAQVREQATSKDDREPAASKTPSLPQPPRRRGTVKEQLAAKLAPNSSTKQLTLGEPPPSSKAVNWVDTARSTVAPVALVRRLAEVQQEAQERAVAELEAKAAALAMARRAARWLKQRAEARIKARARADARARAAEAKAKAKDAAAAAEAATLAAEAEAAVAAEMRSEAIEALGSQVSARRTAIAPREMGAVQELPEESTAAGANVHHDARHAASPQPAAPSESDVGYQLNGYRRAVLGFASPPAALEARQAQWRALQPSASAHRPAPALAQHRPAPQRPGSAPSRAGRIAGRVREDGQGKAPTAEEAREARAEAARRAAYMEDVISERAARIGGFLASCEQELDAEERAVVAGADFACRQPPPALPSRAAQPSFAVATPVHRPPPIRQAAVSIRQAAVMPAPRRAPALPSTWRQPPPAPTQPAKDPNTLSLRVARGAAHLARHYGSPLRRRPPNANLWAAR